MSLYFWIFSQVYGCFVFGLVYLACSVCCLRAYQLCIVSQECILHSSVQVSLYVLDVLRSAVDYVQ